MTTHLHNDACGNCPLAVRICRKCLRPIVTGGLHAPDGNDYHLRHAPWRFRFPVNGPARNHRANCDCARPATVLYDGVWICAVCARIQKVLHRRP